MTTGGEKVNAGWSDHVLLICVPTANNLPGYTKIGQGDKFAGRQDRPVNEVCQPRQWR